MPPSTPTPSPRHRLTLPHLIARVKAQWRWWHLWVVSLARHKAAPLWLGCVSFLESIIFPVPIDPLLVVMVYARPHRFFILATWTALTSVVGGVVGWYLGGLLGEAMVAWLGKESGFATASAQFARHGWLLILIGAFTPLPYKITVITAGIIGVGIAPLVGFSLIGRMARYGLVAAIVRYRANRVVATTLMTLLLALIASMWWWAEHAPL